MDRGPFHWIASLCRVTHSHVSSNGPADMLGGVRRKVARQWAHLVDSLANTAVLFSRILGERPFFHSQSQEPTSWRIKGCLADFSPETTLKTLLNKRLLNKTGLYRAGLDISRDSVAFIQAIRLCFSMRVAINRWMTIQNHTIRWLDCCHGWLYL